MEKSPIISADDSVKIEVVSKSSNKDGVSSIALRHNIIETVVRPYIIYNIKNSVKWANKWKTGHSFFIVSAKIFVMIASIFAFISSSYDLKICSFISGTFGLLSALAIQFSGFSKQQSQKRIAELNELLGSLKINAITDILDNNYSKMEHGEIVNIDGRKFSTQL